MTFEQENRRFFLKLAAMSGGLLASATPAAGETERKGDEIAGTVESVSNNDILDAIAGEEFKQAVANTEYLGVDSQIERFEQEIQNFPLENTAFAVLSSGVAGDAPGDPEEFASTDVGGRNISNYSPDDFDAFNVAEFRIDFIVPEGAESIAFDYKFGTDESPTYLGSEFQDFFEAALILPDGSATNIARLPDDTPVTVDNADNFANTPGGSSQEPEPPLPDPPDTVYNAVTDLQTAERSVTGFEGEELTLVLRIADASDGVFDSAAFIDNVRFGGEVDDQLRPLRDAFDDWRLAVESVSEGLIRSEARAQAELYAEHGDEYAQPMIDMLGYRAGEVPASELDDEFLDIDEDVSAEIDQSIEKQGYEFYQEMFGQVSPDDNVDEISDTFIEYILGVHDDQSNQLLVDGMTISEAIDLRVDELENYEDEFLEDVQAKIDADEYSGSEVQKIASVIEQRTDYIFELSAEATRDELATIDNFTGPEEFDGDITITELDDESAGDVSTDAVVASVLVGFALKKAVGGALTKKGGAAAIKSIKGTETASKIGSTAKSYGIGTASQTAWLSSKSSTVSTFVTKYTPGWAQTLGWTAVDKANPIIDKPIKWSVGRADEFFEYVIGFPPAAQLDATLSDIVIDASQAAQDAIELEYLNPDACLRSHSQTLSINDVSASDIGPTDYNEGIFPPYGRETGEVTITNTGPVSLTPTLEASLFAKDVPPNGLAAETNYPIVFTNSIPTLDPGESATLEFEYTVPIGLLTSGYEVVVEFSQLQGDVIESDSFEAGTFSILSSTSELASGVLSDGESEEHGYQAGEAIETQSTQEDLHSVTFEMEYSNFNADLHLYDEDGNHVGENYETGEFENEIDGAEHSGNDEGALGDEWVSVENPDETYDVEVVVPEVETIIQSESVETQAQGVQQGGGTVEYDIDVVETPDVSGQLDAAMSQAVFEEPNESAETTLLITEASSQKEVSNITIDIDELVRDDAAISGDQLMVDQQDFNLGPGQTQQVEVTVDQPDELLPGTYTGDVTITANGGEVTHEETIAVVVEPPVPYATNEGVVETDGVRDAIDDWRGDAIDDETLEDVIKSWQGGDEIV